MMEQIAIHTEYIQLQNLLKLAALVPTGGMAKEVILDGLVTVNGEVCTQRGRKLRPGDTVEFEGIGLEVVDAGRSA